MKYEIVEEIVRPREAEVIPFPVARIVRLIDIDGRPTDEPEDDTPKGAA